MAITLPESGTIPTVGPQSRLRRTRSRDGMSTGATVLWQVAVFASVIAIWQLFSVLGIGRPVIVQSPGAVATRLVDLIATGELWPNLWSTLSATFIALGLSMLVGIPLGLILGMLPRVRRVLAPFISALNATPRVALAPVFIILFGLDTEGKVALAFTIVVFMLLVNSEAGAMAADPELLRLMATLGASKFAVITKVVLPAAVPSILAGVRLGLIYSLLGVVTSELIAAEGGVGQMIARAAGVFDLATVYAIIVVLMIIAATLNMLTEGLERRLLRWQPPTTR